MTQQELEELTRIVRTYGLKATLKAIYAINKPDTRIRKDGVLVNSMEGRVLRHANIIRDAIGQPLFKRNKDKEHNQKVNALYKELASKYNLHAYTIEHIIWRRSSEAADYCAGPTPEYHYGFCGRKSWDDWFAKKWRIRDAIVKLWEQGVVCLLPELPLTKERDPTFGEIPESIRQIE